MFTLVDKNGYILDYCLENADLKDGEQLVKIYTSFKHVKPRWNGTGWVEGATEDEIEEWKKEHEYENKPTVVELLKQDNEKLKSEIAIIKEALDFLLENNL